MAQEYQLIDPFVSLPEPPQGEHRQLDPNIARWFRHSKALLAGATIDDMIADMDEAGIETAILTADGVPRGLHKSPYTVGQNVDDESFDAVCQKIAAVRARYPGRFHGCIGIDPTGVMRAVRQLERAVRDYSFGSCWMMPALVGLPPNHATYFPVYAKCVELGIPVKINVGIPGPLRPGWVQQPLYLDEVLLAFPELIVVGTHVGHPWYLETVALLQKHTNFYLITCGWAPSYIPREIWHFANTRGPHKVMWSSDYPLLPMQRCAREGWEVPLKDEVKRRYLRENTLEVFKLG